MQFEPGAAGGGGKGNDERQLIGRLPAHRLPAHRLPADRVVLKSRALSLLLGFFQGLFALICWKDLWDSFYFFFLGGGGKDFRFGVGRFVWLLWDLYGVIEVLLKRKK